MLNKLNLDLEIKILLEIIIYVSYAIVVVILVEIAQKEIKKWAGCKIRKCMRKEDALIVVNQVICDTNANLRKR